MPSITDSTDDPAKILLIGENGSGKTGAKASLVAAGYQLRMIDTDKGFRVLRSLLTDPRYPYARIIHEKGIDLNKAVNYQPIDISMGLRTVTEKKMVGDRIVTSSETILAPKNASAWGKVIGLLENWKDGSINYGHVQTWDGSCVLDFDTFSTLSMQAYYFIQQLNGRLGARDDGYDFQRDVGAAQSQLRRLLEMVSDSSIKCNVIINSHITRVDLTSGFSQSPEQRARSNAVSIDAKGFPSAIGRALSPQMGKYFNDIYIVQASGSGQNVKRKIHTVPTDNVSAKNSVFLEREYDVSTGLAEIFAALRGSKELPGVITPVDDNSNKGGRDAVKVA